MLNKLIKDSIELLKRYEPGVRAEESVRRKKQNPVEEKRILPIFNWSEIDVWEFLGDKSTVSCIMKVGKE